jgi:hypothetical protein
MSVKANDPNASFYGLWINGCSGEDAPPCMYDPRWKHMSNARFFWGVVPSRFGKSVVWTKSVKNIRLLNMPLTINYIAF